MGGPGGRRERANRVRAELSGNPDGRERADRVRAELNGNPVQSHGYQTGFSPPRVDRAAGRS